MEVFQLISHIGQRRALSVSSDFRVFVEELVEQIFVPFGQDQIFPVWLRHYVNHRSGKWVRGRIITCFFRDPCVTEFLWHVPQPPTSERADMMPHEQRMEAWYHGAHDEQPEVANVFCCDITDKRYASDIRDFLGKHSQILIRVAQGKITQFLKIDPSLRDQEKLNG